MNFKKYLIILLTLISSSSFAQLSGTYSIGSGGSDDFACLTCDSGIFKMIADSGVAGNVIIEISTDLSNENGNQKLTGWSSPFTILIKPKSASTKTISYSNSTSGILMKLDSVSNLTIDGSMAGSGRFLRFVSLESGAAVIEINNDCKNVEINNCEIISRNASNFTVSAGAINIRSFGTTGNDNISIVNNLIKSNSSLNLRFGIMISPPNIVGQVSDNIVVEDNDFESIMVTGIEIASGIGKVNKAIIRGNSFYSGSTLFYNGPQIGQVMSFIYLNNGEEHIIEGNYFGGEKTHATGNKMLLNFKSFSGKLFVFRVGSGVSGNKPIVFKRNVVKNFQIIGSTSTFLNLSIFKINSACVAPIILGSETVANDGNIIGSTNVNANNLAGSSIYIKERRNSSNNSFFVFQVEGASNNIVANNKIGGILMDNNSALGMSAQLIFCSGATSTKIVKNKIGGAIDNVVKNCKGDFKLIYSKGNSTISDNTMDGIIANGSFENDLNLIHVDPNNKNVNVISNSTGRTASIRVKNSSTVPKSFFGLNISGGNATDLNVVGNSFDRLMVNADDNSKIMNVFGIKSVVSISGSCRIDTNFVFLSQESNGEVVGIDFFSPNNAAISVKRNTVRTNTSRFFENQFVGIDFTGKVTHNNRVRITNNMIGDTSIVVSATTSAVKISGGASGKSATSFGIRVTEANDFVMIGNNAVGGVHTKSSGRELPFIPILVASVRDSVNVIGNKIGSTGKENLWFENHSEFEYLMYFDLPDGLKKATIKGNTVSGVKFSATASDTRIFGMRATRGTAIDNLWIQDNKVMNFIVEGTGNKEFTGIFSNNNNTHIIGNIVKNISINSSKVGDQFWGIFVNEGGSTHEILDNQISDIKLTQDQNAANNAIGIFFAGTSSTFHVIGNIVRGFDLGISDSNALFQGILITSCKTANINNNVVLHNPGTQISSQQAYGIYDFAKSGSIFIYHNTVDITLNFAPGGRGRTAGYYKNNDALRKISNNIFANHSPAVGGPHYALYFATSSGAIGSDFNMLSVKANTNELVFFGIAYDIKGWQKKGFGLKSIAPPSQNLVNQTSGMQLTALGNDIGLTNLGIASDLVGNARPLDGGFDLGAYEISSSSLPSGVTSLNNGFANNSTGFNLFPNPASNIVHLNLENNFSDDLEFRIYNTTGQLVLQYFPNRTYDSMDVTSLQPGMYIIHLLGKNGLVEEKRFTKI